MVFVTEACELSALARPCSRRRRATGESPERPPCRCPGMRIAPNARRYTAPGPWSDAGIGGEHRLQHNAGERCRLLVVRISRSTCGYRGCRNPAFRAADQLSRIHRGRPFKEGLRASSFSQEAGIANAQAQDRPAPVLSHGDRRLANGRRGLVGTWLRLGRDPAGSRVASIQIRAMSGRDST